MSNELIWLSMFKDTMTSGDVIAPRGLKIREIRDLQISIDPNHPFMGFPSRKYDVSYFKKEMLWKLGANRMDDSIKQHAKMWESVQNPDGSFNSNYGHYWFGPQNGFWFVVQELMRDMDSRQAVIPMLSKEHMTPETVDKVCTTAVGFHIRNFELHMSVQMRSSDQIFGLGTDIPTFATLYRMVHAVLNAKYDLGFGRMSITAMSSHIYERHFEMVANILSDDVLDYQEIYMPRLKSPIEVINLISTKGKITSPMSEFEEWLIS